MYKRAIFLTLIVSYILIFAVVSTSRMAMAQNPSEFKTYTDTSNGFTLQYPPDWTKDASNIQNLQFVLNSPDGSGKLLITAGPIPDSLLGWANNMSLDELVKSFTLPVGALSLSPDELSTLGVNIIELNSEGYFLSGHPAGRIVMTSTNDSSNLKMMGLATIVNNGSYFIMYMADTTTYNQHLADAQKIIDSFKIITTE